jgi:hypothetical protein
MGQRTFPSAMSPNAANLVKLSGNFLIASVIEALGVQVEKPRAFGHRTPPIARSSFPNARSPN